jgi:hypothetical protein
MAFRQRKRVTFDDQESSAFDERLRVDPASLLEQEVGATFSRVKNVNFCLVFYSFPTFI